MLALLPFIVGAAFCADSGPVGPITLYELKNCEPDINNIDLDVKLETESDGSNSLTASFAIPEDFGEEVQFRVVADKWENDDWKRNVWSMNPASFLKFINENVEKTWANFREAIEPKIEDPMKVPKGEYKLDKHQQDWHDVELSQVIYGRFLATVYLIVNGEEFACLQAELETFEDE
ncbi:hypothetical protein TcasGA2_TC006588 [Tribolium castaneum]|uniref:Uncharacterized protein n=1 Tax=Tribolium castaneum TaxID=7070 RepID=D6WXQ2_TRICA|nr:PREDICTED: uncharacterized protein LOC103314027 [Tribolium castaneum]EFA08887.1 hypothetical protein TcasGA2_TC006588 [Tribolium castaneum]|eukprot:XP_008196970.1 PREDICTED: uncharacterized protein LOC103314027 [Tribolium castaneum]